jgi:hypothetical protein
MGANQVRISRIRCLSQLSLNPCDLFVPQALRDASMLLPSLVSLARSALQADPEEMTRLIEDANASFETEMIPRAFGWVKASNRSAGMDVTTWEGKALIYALWLALSLAGCFATILEMIGLKESNDPRM